MRMFWKSIWLGKLWTNLETTSKTRDGNGCRKWI